MGMTTPATDAGPVGYGKGLIEPKKVVGSVLLHIDGVKPDVRLALYDDGTSDSLHLGDEPPGFRITVKEIDKP